MTYKRIALVSGVLTHLDGDDRVMAPYMVW